MVAFIDSICTAQDLLLVFVLNMTEHRFSTRRLKTDEARATWGGRAATSPEK